MEVGGGIADDVVKTLGKDAKFQKKLWSEMMEVVFCGMGDLNSFKMS